MALILKSNLKQHVSHWGARLLDHLLPPRCLSCGTGAQDAGRVCANCWKKLTFIQGPICRCCGYPFDFDHLMEHSLCGSCCVKMPAFDLARAALRYDDGSRRMILSFKHGDRTEYADFFARLLIQASHQLDLSNALVIPVPLHKQRLRARRYNQAALIAKVFAEKKALPYCPDMIIREKHTPPQQGNYSLRKKNLAGAFRIKDIYKNDFGGKNDFRGRKIILIDDVYTTGATAGACARILKRGGCGPVTILTVTRIC